VEAHRQLFFDSYRQNRHTGSFILIDPITNETLGAGMISQAASEHRSGPVSAAERRARIGHIALVIYLQGADLVLAQALERHLFDDGYLVYVTDQAEAATIATRAGIIAVLFGTHVPGGLTEEPHITLDATQLERSALFHAVAQEIEARKDRTQWTGGAGI